MGTDLPFIAFMNILWLDICNKSYFHDGTDLRVSPYPVVKMIVCYTV
jgi:hypothetical protein